MPSISVVIPAFNEEKYLPGCLEAVLMHKPPEVREILVVDNASTDATSAIAAKHPGVRVVREEKKGPSHARQRGYKETTGDLIAYLDADCIINASWFPVLIEEFAKDPGLLCLSGPYRYTREELPVLHHRFFAKMFWYVLAPTVYRITRFAVSGGNFAVKRSALDRIGGIDTSIAFYGDDTNLARRIHDVGTVKFTLRLWCHTSGRRLNKLFFHSAWHYLLNYASEALIKRPVTSQYQDVR